LELSRLYVSSLPLSFGGFQASFEKTPLVFLGVPYDATATYRPGARFAPRVIREVSSHLETYSWRAKFDLEDVKVHDLGDINVVQGSTAETLNRIEGVVRELNSAAKIFGLVGGEHTVSYGAIRGLGKLGVVDFDAHMDLRDRYPERQEYSHATVMRRICEAVGASNIVQVGVRAICKEEYEYAQREGIAYITSRDIVESGTSEIAAKIKEQVKGLGRLYFTVDLDVLDPAYAPAVGNPEPEGISTRNLLDIIQSIVDGRIVGFDVCEVCPAYDSGTTAAQAARIILELFSLAHRAKNLR